MGTTVALAVVCATIISSGGHAAITQEFADPVGNARAGVAAAPTAPATAAASKRLRRCRLASTRDGLAKRLSLIGRTLSASASIGCAAPARHVAAVERQIVRRWPRALPSRFSVRGRGDDSRFACRATRRGSRYTVRCASSAKDRFAYHVVVTQKPRPTPPPPAEEIPTPSPPSEPSPPPAPPSTDGCDPNYAGACLNPNASDYDCAGGSGNGPLYVQGPITVVGNDHYGLDSDGDGVACES